MTDSAHITQFLEQCYAEGVAAGSWVVDGNTSDQVCAAILEGLEDGDPAVCDALPSPLWNGEWADEPAYEQRAECAGLTADEADDVYERALVEFTRGVEDEVVRACRAGTEVEAG